MKLLILFICILLSILQIFLPTKKLISNTYCLDVNYAKIISHDAYLFNSPTANLVYSNTQCLLEYSYYVKIISSTEKFHYVEYQDIEGYVENNKVQKVIGTPTCPYPKGINLTSYNYYCNLRLTPESSKTNNIYSVIPPNCSNFKYIGKINGEEGIDFMGKIWYLVKYENKIGYIYSGYVLNITKILLNNESLKYDTVKYNLIINPLSNQSCVIIILTMLLPTFVILFMLFKKPTNFKRINKVKHNKIKINDNF